MAVKKYIITNGLMEWNALIHSGGTVLHVPFSGGSATEVGIKPASYTTNNKVYQQIIERSDYFTKGCIKIGYEEPEEGDFDSKKDVEAPTVVENPKNGVEGPKDEGGIVIDVENIDEARDYLQEHFDLKATDLINDEDVKETAAKLGIEFSGI